MEVRAYIEKRNIGENDEVRGMWFVAPILFEDVAEQLELENEKGQYRITDIDCPFPLWLSDKADVYIKNVNEVNKKIQELLESFSEKDISLIIKECYKNLEDMYNHKDLIINSKNVKIVDTGNKKYICYVK